LLNTGTIGNILLNGDGPILVNAANGTVGTVTASATSTGNITFNSAVAYSTGAVTMSGFGIITWPGAVTSVTVNGNVLINSIFTFVTAAVGPAISTDGRIVFPDLPTVVTGNVQNDAQFSGTTDQNNDANGVIRFDATGPNNVTINGDVINNVVGNVTTTAAPNSDLNGHIRFQFTAGTFTARDLINNATWNNGSGDNLNNARIWFANAVVSNFTFRNIINNSVLSVAGNRNGDIDLQGPAAGP